LCQPRAGTLPPVGHSQSESPRHSGAAGACSNANAQRLSISSKATGQSTRNARTKVALRCYEFEGIGHFARKCPTRFRREEGNSRSPEKRGQTERSNRSGSPGRKPPIQTNRESKTSLEKSGNGREA
jgi:hypothetical protein